MLIIQSIFWAPPPPPPFLGRMLRAEKWTRYGTHCLGGREMWCKDSQASLLAPRVKVRRGCLGTQELSYPGWGYWGRVIHSFNIYLVPVIYQGAKDSEVLKIDMVIPWGQVQNKLWSVSHLSFSLWYVDIHTQTYTHTIVMTFIRMSFSI